jgi:hypothetical protein
MKHSLFDVLRSAHDVTLIDTASSSGNAGAPSRHACCVYEGTPLAPEFILEFREDEAVQFTFPDQEVEFEVDGSIRVTDAYEGTYVLILEMRRPMNAADVKSWGANSKG